MRLGVRKFWFYFIVLFFSACTTKNHSTQTMQILLVSPMIKINDAAFLKKESFGLNLQIYKLGKAFVTLKIRDKICLGGVCYQKQIFNEKFFKNAHYDAFLSDILNSKPLYAGKNLQKNECGFYQKLESKDYMIFYEVCGENVRFEDRISKVKLQLVR